MAVPSRSRVIVESVLGAIISVIVAKVAIRFIGGEISTAVLSGIAAGVVALVFARRSVPRPHAGRNLEEEPAVVPTEPREAGMATPVPSEGSPTAQSDANPTSRVS